MANFRGKGSMGGVNILARTFHNAATKDGKAQFIDMQMDHRDAQAAGQTNLHLTSSKSKDENGKTVYNNSSAYSTSQYEAIQEKAGPNTEPIVNKDGEEIGQVLAFKANVMPSPKGNGALVNTKTLDQSDHKLESNTLDNQYGAMKEATEAAKANRAAQKDAPEAAAETTAPEAEAAEAESNEPALG